MERTYPDAEALDALELAAIRHEKEIGDLKSRLFQVETDAEIWTSRYDELLKELNRQRSELIDYVTTHIVFNQPPDFSLLMRAEELRVLNEVIKLADLIEERWTEKQNSRE